jgi:fibronectin-binding autotransporter adhesin
MKTYTPTAALLLASMTALSAQAQSVYSGATGGNWSLGTNWTPNGEPITGNTANLNTTGSVRNVIYDASASGTVGNITIAQGSAFANSLELQRSLSFTTLNILNTGTSGGNNAGRITLNGTQGLTVGSGSTVNFGNSTTASTTADVISGNSTAGVAVSGGTVNVNAASTGTGSQIHTVAVPYSQTSGSLVINSVQISGGPGGNARLNATSNFSVTGGSILFTGSAGNINVSNLVMKGATNVIGNTVSVTNSDSSTTLVAQIALISTGNQTLSMGTTNNFTVRNDAGNVAGLSATKTLTSTAAANNIGSILLQNGAGATSGVHVLSFSLGSNLTLASGKTDAFTFNLGNPSTASKQTTSIELNGFTYDGTAATNNSGAFAPAIGNISSKFAITSSTTGGVFKFASFNLNGNSTADTSIGNNVTLHATGTNANVLSTGTGGNGTISSGSRFLYTGSSSTLASARSIGKIEVGDGTNASVLTTSSTVTALGDVKVNSQGTLGLSANNSLVAGNLILNGGTLKSNAFTNAFTGTLDLDANSIINLNGGGIFTFADSTSAVWGANTLSITGTFVDGVSIRFGTSAAGLAVGQLANININGSAAMIDSSGFLSVAIPEPSSFAALAGFVMLGLVACRRRRA